MNATPKTMTDTPGAALRAMEIILTAQPGGRHAALYDAARILAEADHETATAFLTAGALAIGLRENSATRKAIARGLAAGGV